MQRHRQRVVAARRAARAHTHPYAYADEQRADHRGQQRHVRQLRPERIEPLKNRVERGKTAARKDGIEDKGAPQRAPSADIAGRVEHKPRDGGRNAEPVVQQQRQPQHAALRHAGEGMDVVQAKGENGAAENRQRAAAPGKIRTEKTQNKTPFQNIAAYVFIV